MNNRPTFFKIIFWTNLIFYLIILVIPIYDRDIRSGLVGQFFLGIYQLIIGLVYLFQKNNKKATKAYWLFVILYFSSWVILAQFGKKPKTIINIMIIIIPMIIGLYHLILSYKFSKYQKQ